MTTAAMALLVAAAAAAAAAAAGAAPDGLGVDGAAPLLADPAAAQPAAAAQPVLEAARAGPRRVLLQEGAAAPRLADPAAAQPTTPAQPFLGGGRELQFFGSGPFYQCGEMTCYEYENDSITYAVLSKFFGQSYSFGEGNSISGTLNVGAVLTGNISYTDTTRITERRDGWPCADNFIECSQCESRENELFLRLSATPAIELSVGLWGWELGIDLSTMNITGEIYVQPSLSWVTRGPPDGADAGCESEACEVFNFEVGFRVSTSCWGTCRFFGCYSVQLGYEVVGALRQPTDDECPDEPAQFQLITNQFTVSTDCLSHDDGYRNSPRSLNRTVGPAFDHAALYDTYFQCNLAFTESNVPITPPNPDVAGGLYITECEECMCQLEWRTSDSDPAPLVLSGDRVGAGKSGWNIALSPLKLNVTGNILVCASNTDHKVHPEGSDAADREIKTVDIWCAVVDSEKNVVRPLFKAVSAVADSGAAPEIIAAWPTAFYTAKDTESEIHLIWVADSTMQFLNLDDASAFDSFRPDGDGTYEKCVIGDAHGAKCKKPASKVDSCTHAGCARPEGVDGDKTNKWKPTMKDNPDFMAKIGLTSDDQIDGDCPPPDGCQAEPSPPPPACEDSFCSKFDGRKARCSKAPGCVFESGSQACMCAPSSCDASICSQYRGGRCTKDTFGGAFGCVWDKASRTCGCPPGGRRLLESASDAGSSGRRLLDDTDGTTCESCSLSDRRPADAIALLQYLQENEYVNMTALNRQYNFRLLDDCPIIGGYVEMNINMENELAPGRDTCEEAAASTGEDRACSISAELVMRNFLNFTLCGDGGVDDTQFLLGRDSTQNWKWKSCLDCDA